MAGLDLCLRLADHPVSCCEGDIPGEVTFDSRWLGIWPIFIFFFDAWNEPDIHGIGKDHVC